MVSRNANGWTVGTDSRGLARIFFYQNGDKWALSSSFYELIKHLRSNGVRLTHLDSLLAALGVRRGFNDQLTTSMTPIANIELLPSFASALINHPSIEILSSPPRKLPDYDTALAEYISVWRSRLSTLTTDDRISIQCDLSGGIDSRAVLAFMIAEEHFDPNNHRFAIVSAPHKINDFEVASNISDFYRLPLGVQRQKTKSKMGQSRALEEWRRDSLGVYLPVYLHSSQFDFGAVHAHGAGGGNFRPYYSGRDVSSQAAKGSAYMHPDAFTDWRDRVAESSKNLQAFRPDTPPLVLHYREFRNRFHFGHRPHHNIVFSPLESILTDMITDRPDGRDGRQIYFDVMESLAPGLKDIPFDQESKSPTPTNIQDLTIVNAATVSTGRIFGTPVGGGAVGEDGDAYAEWIEEGALALAKEEVAEAIGLSASESAQTAVDEARVNKRRLQSHNADLLNLSFAKSADLIISN
ncbi:hypothetical protein [Brachybacterium sp. AOP3-A1-3]|uniref:hypothetical protein n=1 Tax=Brachybacterium sp. AOP3-A1-3 TaxID=3457699 RepID=UPI004033D448